tara:strand:- start:1640 stop:2011 length:372 start_codon:yes stop_codon:yes gene_type:complete
MHSNWMDYAHSHFPEESSVADLPVVFSPINFPVFSSPSFIYFKEFYFLGKKGIVFLVIPSEVYFEKMDPTVDEIDFDFFSELQWNGSWEKGKLDLDFYKEVKKVLWYPLEIREKKLFFGIGVY